MNCLNCEKELKSNQKKFCSNKCRSEYHKKEIIEQYSEKYNTNNYNEIVRLKYNEYMRLYNNNRYNDFKKFVIEYLGGCCSKCGSTNNLEIDHIDPSKKLFTIAKKWNTNKNIIIEELNKCQLLCDNCHHKKSNIDGSHEFERLKGEKCNLSKLKKEEILLIRKLYDTDKYTKTKLAKYFHTTRSNIYQIVNRITWKHI